VADLESDFNPTNFKSLAAPPWYVSGHQEISEATESIAADSKTWEDIAFNAMDLLCAQRVEEKASWEQTQKLYRRVAGNTLEIIDSPERDAAAKAQIAGEETYLTNVLKRQKERVEKPHSGTALVPLPPGTPGAGSRPSTVGGAAAHEPAPWKKKGALHKMLNEQDLELAPSTPAGPSTPGERRARRAQRARLAKQKAIQAVKEPKRDYAHLIKTQTFEMGFLERTYKMYQANLDELLKEQEEIRKEVEENPWDLAAGVIRDEGERILKRKLLFQIGACPKELDAKDFEMTKDHVEMAIDKELDAIVKSIDQDSNGILDVEELKSAAEANPQIKQRLQCLKINLALSPSNRLRSNNPWRKAMLSSRLERIRDEADLDKNGYIDLDELQEIVNTRPEITGHLQNLGLHLRRVPSTRGGILA